MRRLYAARRSGFCAVSSGARASYALFFTHEPGVVGAICGIGSSRRVWRNVCDGLSRTFGAGFSIAVWIAFGAAPPPPALTARAFALTFRSAGAPARACVPVRVHARGLFRSRSCSRNLVARGRVEFCSRWLHSFARCRWSSRSPASSCSRSCSRSSCVGAPLFSVLSSSLAGCASFCRRPRVWRGLLFFASSRPPRPETITSNLAFYVTY